MQMPGHDEGAMSMAEDSFDPARFAPPPPYNVPIEPTITGRTIAGLDRIDIAGEGARQAAFEQTVGPKTKSGATITRVLVQLARDEHDPSDPNAVAAYIGQHHAGYIPRNSAKSWHKVIKSLHDDNMPAVCQGEVVGGWHRPPKSTGSYGLVIFASAPPRRLTADDAIILSRSGRVSLEGEENCQPYLAAVLGTRAGQPLVAHLDTRHSHRITANHGGHVLGWLTPAMSATYKPLLLGLEMAGLPTTCVATVRRGKQKLEVSLGLPTGSNLERALAGLP